MKKNRAKRLAAYLKSGAPDVKFDMLETLYPNTDGKKPIACIAGVADLMRRAEKRGIPISEVRVKPRHAQDVMFRAAEWLGLREDEWDLFLGRFIATPKQAAKAVKRVAAGKAPW